MSSDITGNLIKTAIARILAYTQDGGTTVTTYVGSGSSARVYVSKAPDDAQYPYVVLRKMESESDPDYPNLREEYVIEAMCYGRPRSKEQETEQIADLVEEALLTWHESSAANGLTYGVELDKRDTEPAFPEAVDSDIVAIRVRVRCCTWSKRLSNALT